jgi:hypothetical protein
LCLLVEDEAGKKTTLPPDPAADGGGLVFVDDIQVTK